MRSQGGFLGLVTGVTVAIVSILVGVFIAYQIYNTIVSTMNVSGVWAIVIVLIPIVVVAVFIFAMLSLLGVFGGGRRR